jgi:hypothetical protein
MQFPLHLLKSLAASRNFTHKKQLLSWKLIVSQLLKKSHAFLWIRMFFVLFTRSCHWSVPWASWAQSSPFPSTLFNINFKLLSHLPLAFPSVLFVSGFSSSFCTNSLPSPCLLHVQPIQAALYVAYHIINKHVSWPAGLEAPHCVTVSFPCHFQLPCPRTVNNACLLFSTWDGVCCCFVFVKCWVQISAVLRSVAMCRTPSVPADAPRCCLQLASWCHEMWRVCRVFIERWHCNCTRHSTRVSSKTDDCVSSAMSVRLSVCRNARLAELSAMKFGFKGFTAL